MGITGPATYMPNLAGMIGEYQLITVLPRDLQHTGMVISRRLA
jgi:hypothetical protein